MTDAAAAFTSTADAACRTAGMIAARARGDLDGAEHLLAGSSDAERAAGAVFLADLVVALLARAEGREVAEVASELSVQIAAVSAQR